MKCISKYLYTLSIIVLISLTPNSAYLQFAVTADIDSLEKVIPKLSNTEKIDALNALAEQYLRFSNTKAFENATLALQLSRQLNYIEGEIKSKVNLAHQTFFSGKFSEGIDMLYQTAEYAGQNKLYYFQSLLLNKSGRLNLNIKEYSNAFEDFQKALNIAKENNDNENISYAYHNLGLFYLLIHEPNSALENVLLSLEFAKKQKNDSYLPFIYIAIGRCYFAIGNLNNRKKYIDSVLAFKNPNIISLCEYYITTGDDEIIYYNNIDSAMQNFNNALTYALFTKEKTLISTIYTKISHVYFMKNDFEKAVEYDLKALEERKQININYLLGSSYTNIGTDYIAQKKYDKALEYLRIGLSYHINNAGFEYLVNDYSKHYILFKEINKPDSALAYLKIRDAYKDSIKIRDVADSLSTILYKFETEKKNKELANLEIQKTNNKQLFFTAVILLLLISGTIIALQVRKNINLNKQLFRINNSLEEIVKTRTFDIENESITLEETLLKLSNSEKQFRLISENAKDALYRYCLFPERKYELISPSMETITGYTLEEIYKFPFKFKFIQQNDINNALKYTEKNKTYKKSFVTNTKWTHKNGNIIWVEQKLIPDYDDTGKATAIEVIARDITELRKSQDTIYIALGKGKKIKESKMQFYTKIFQDFRTPIASINLSTDKLKNILDKINPKNAEIAERIKKETIKMMEVLDNILDIQNDDSLND